MKFLKGHRKTTWAIWGWCIFMGVWIIAGISTASEDDCASETTRDLRRLCEDANDAGTAIGVGALIVLWFMGFCVLAIIWFMTNERAKRRAAEAALGQEP